MQINSRVSLMVKIDEENKKTNMEKYYYKYIQRFSGKHEHNKETYRELKYKNGNYKKEPNGSFRTENYNIATENFTRWA